MRYYLPIESLKGSMSEDQDYKSNINESVMGEFCLECDEIVQRVMANLGLIEKNGFRQDIIDSVYRDVHTLKGSALLFGFKTIGALAHVMEAGLEPVRRIGIEIKPEFIDALYLSLDAVEIELSHLKDAQSPVNSFESVQCVISKIIETSIKNLGLDLSTERDHLFLIDYPQTTKFSDAKSIESTSSVNETKVHELKVNTPVVLKSNPISTIQVQTASTHLEELPAVDSSGGVNSDLNGSIRVQIGILDRLMNLAGELVLVRNQVMQFANHQNELGLVKLSQRLDLVTAEVQGEVMKTRLQPIGSVLSKFQRVVRDLSRELNKKIELLIIGSETELDKTLLEAIKDPINHLIRNACDHGIETPEERIKFKKSEIGQIAVRAFHEGGQVVIDITDDGKGLKKEKILQKAIERGLVNQEQSQMLSEREIFNFIFLPGFSTADQVTTVSGRGVGMDVVKINIEKIGGVVDLSSAPGKGVLVRIRIPLTLAIVPALIVRQNDQNFAIPQIKLVELIRLDASSEEKKN